MLGLAFPALSPRKLGKSLFSVDLRALAAFRIGTATLLLIDLLQRARDLGAFYTDRGVLPRVPRIELYEFGDEFGRIHMWSLHMASGQAWFQVLLFLIAACATFAMLIGFRTRWSALLTATLLR